MKALLLILMFVVVLTIAIPAQAELTQEIVDSMFVIASSGAMKYRDQVQPTIDSMAAYQAEIVPFLIPKLGTIDARERQTLENIFRAIGESAVPLLNDALLTSKDSLQLSRVALMLYYLPDTSSVTNLLTVVNHHYYWLRYEAMRALGKIGDARGKETVVAALRDSNEIVRTIAAVSAGRMITGKELFDVLVPVLDDPYYGVRFSAMESLKGLDCETKQEIIFQLLDTELSYFQKSYLGMIMVEDSCEYDVEKIKKHCAGTMINNQLFLALYKRDCAEAIDRMIMSIMTDSNFESNMQRSNDAWHLENSLAPCDEKATAADSR